MATVVSKSMLWNPRECYSRDETIVLEYRTYSTSPSCAGVSNAMTRNSSKNSGSGTMKDEDGKVSTTIPVFASWLMDS